MLEHIWEKTMQKSKSYVANAVLLVVFAGAVAAAEPSWIPVVADRSVTEIRIDADGVETIVSSKSGEFLRTSSGKQLTTETSGQEGSPPEVVESTLIDFPQGAFYRILNTTRQVIERKSRSVLPIVPSTQVIERARSKAVGEETVNGVHCYGFPVIGHGRKDVNASGMAWRSIQYDLPVKTVSEFSSGGKTTRIIDEIVNIRIGQEPDPERMVISAGFTKVELSETNAAGTSCGTCDRR